MEKRWVLWAWDIVEGNPRVSPIHPVYHGDSPTQSSQPLTIHVRKEPESTVDDVVRHHLRTEQTHRDIGPLCFEGHATGEEERR